MIRRLLCACVGAVFVGVLAVPHVAVAKPPDLPEDGKFTLAPAGAPFAPFVRRRPSRKTPPAWYDHPQSSAESGVLSGVLRDREREAMVEALGGNSAFCGWTPPRFEGEWKWLISYWTAYQQPPTPEQNDGYVRPIVTGVDYAYQVATDAPASEDETPEQTVEVLPMPQEEPEVTCPYLRQQRADRHACQLADPEMGRDVMDNLKRLEEADNLLKLAQELADNGCFDEAMECCEQAADLCPGSPCAARANAAIIEYEWERIWRPENPSFVPPAWARYDVFPDDETPGTQLMVSGMMKACHLLMGQGMQHQAAELARQAYALDPQRVAADPLVYKMHLLAETPLAQPDGASEESEPPTCPYCPKTGKPINAIVPKKKKSKANDTSHMPPLSEIVPLEIAINTTSGLRVNAECPLGGNVYHLRYRDGSLSIWKTTDDSKAVDPRQIEYEWERIWFTEMPSRLTPERIHGGIRP